MELIIKASAGGRNVPHITLARLLSAALFVFFIAAAHSPSTATTTKNSVLKLPTDANSTASEEEEACCDKCGICYRSFPPICNCNDVHEKCPSWCLFCQEVDGGHQCMDFKPNFCKNNCGKNGRCCDKCGICTRSIPPICNCFDVMNECPSWCNQCEEVDGGKVCTDFVVNYCENTCSS